ncbi:MAG: FAD/NAD(P)-binding protein [Caulobacterales bacterium]
MSAEPIGTLVIVGAGMGATMLLTSLVDLASPPLRLVILDPDPEAPRGEAYQPGPASRLLNTRARDMGLTAKAADGFTAFAAAAMAAQVEAVATAFLPRALYGDFLVTGMTTAMQALSRQGWEIRRHPWRVQEIRPHADHFTVLADGGVIDNAQDVVLAVGAVRRPLLPRAQSPWNIDVDLKDPRPALIAGAGLTGIDASVDLFERGFAGPIVLASLDGGVPHVQPAAPLPPFALAFPEPLAPSNLIARLRLAARTPQQDWRAVIDALRPHTPRLWAAMPAKRRRAVLSGPRMEMWGRLRHRLPAQTGTYLQALIASGKAQTRKMRVTGEERDAAVIIDARGFDMCQANHPLSVQLRRDSVGRPCPTGFGFMPNADMIIGRTNKARLFCLGSALVGAHLETTAAPEIRAQAEIVAGALCVFKP